MIAAVAAVLWERRPRLHRNPRFSTAGRLPRPVERLCGRPGVDPLLPLLARLGGDWEAHAVVHGAPIRVLTHDDREET